MRDLWYRGVHRLIAAIYFSRISLLHPERLPRSGPVLYLGLHRNGAVDGFVYRRVLHNPVFLISAQLRASWFGRFFFDGIAIHRTKDEGDRSGNALALEACVEHLRLGGELFVFPEGTSSLGPKHLPFKSGAVWLILRYAQVGGPPLQVIPLGIHYERPWAFRSRVEVAVGKPMRTDLPEGTGDFERIKLLKGRMHTALQDVGVNVASADYLQQIETLAYAATLGSDRSYFASLKALEQAIPESVARTWERLERAASARRLCRHQGVPLIPLGNLTSYTLALGIAGPVVIAAILLNLPPCLASWFAGRKWADDVNVISLWRVLVGIPAFALWVVLLAALALFLREGVWLLVYASITVLGITLYYRVKKLAVAVCNGVRHPELQASALEPPTPSRLSAL